MLNGVSLVPSTIEPTRVCIDQDLVEGQNTVSLEAMDTGGSPLLFESTLWAGTQTILVNLINDDGTPFLDPTTVVASLSDNENVKATLETSTGGAEFTNLPPRTVIFSAFGAGGEAGSAAGVAGDVSAVSLTLSGFLEPSDIENNDFSSGLDGWNMDNLSAPGSATIVDHVEDVGPISRRLEDGLENKDLRLDTNFVEGETTISRSFVTKPGVKGVEIRYRFITSEVPGGWFGSQYNDYFSVLIRSQNGGGVANEANSMNGLGLAAFDYDSGSTDWRTTKLPINADEDTVQVDITVANVGDDYLQSQVEVDFVEELVQSLCNVAEDVGGPSLLDGHAALVLADTSTDPPALTTYGNWSDSHPNTTDNGANADIRVNFPGDSRVTLTFIASRSVTSRYIFIIGITPTCISVYFGTLVQLLRLFPLLALSFRGNLIHFKANARHHHHSLRQATLPLLDESADLLAPTPPIVQWPPLPDLLQVQQLSSYPPGLVPILRHRQNRHWLPPLDRRHSRHGSVRNLHDQSIFRCSSK